VWDKKIRAEQTFYRKHYFSETVKRINREKVLKACWRMMTLTLSLPFVKNNLRTKYKLKKYFLVYRHAKDSLRTIGSSGHFVGGTGYF